MAKVSPIVPFVSLLKLVIIELPQWDISKAFHINREERTNMVRQTRSFLWGHNIEFSCRPESVHHATVRRTEGSLYALHPRGQL